MVRTCNVQQGHLKINVTDFWIPLYYISNQSILFTCILIHVLYHISVFLLANLCWIYLRKRGRIETELFQRIIVMFKSIYKAIRLLFRTFCGFSFSLNPPMGFEAADIGM